MAEPWDHSRRRPFLGGYGSISLLIATVLAGLPAAFSATARPRVDEPAEAYELVARTTRSLLPPALGELLRAHTRAFERAALDGFSGDATAADDGAQWHYILLDVAAGEGDWRVRHAAACAFPRDHDRAVALFRRNGQRRGGSLPWALVERLDALSGALKAGLGSNVAQEAGIIVHLAVDAAMPFHATTASVVSDADKTASSPTDAAGDGAAYADLQERLRFALGRLLREGFAEGFDVSVERNDAADGPLDAVFETLLDSHALLEPLVVIDAQLVEELDVEGPMSFREQDAYYARFAVRAGPILRSRLEVAARLAADLIGETWRRAAESSLAQPKAASTAAGIDPKTVPASGSGFVGSRNSEVFHRPTCTHAARIRLTNQVRFPTTQDALQAGRTPCKSCKPDQQNEPDGQ